MKVSVFITTDEEKVRRPGEDVEGVGVMKDEEIKFEELEVSNILNGEGDTTLLQYTLKYISLMEVDKL